MYVGKRKIVELKRLSFISETLSEYGYNFHENAPDLWSDEDKKLYDMLSIMEFRLHNAYINILSVKSLEEHR
jgi:hypothetical protein